MSGSSQMLDCRWCVHLPVQREHLLPTVDFRSRQLQAKAQHGGTDRPVGAAAAAAGMAPDAMTPQPPCIQSGLCGSNRGCSRDGTCRDHTTATTHTVRPVSMELAVSMYLVSRPKRMALATVTPQPPYILCTTVMPVSMDLVSLPKQDLLRLSSVSTNFCPTLKMTAVSNYQRG